MLPYEILSQKRAGRTLTPEAIADIVAGAADGSWSDGQLAAFLMAAAIRGLDLDETRALTRGMLESGEQWELRREVPQLCDKHSTGGIGDKISLPLAPLLAVCGLPVVMLTGRGLGHTGGTADKLEAVPGLVMGFDRERCLEQLRRTGLAIGIATGEVAPADKRLYALRDQTGTVESLPLITASILSKKLATGAGALVLDVKVGNGAFLPGLDEASALARMLVDTANGLGCPTSALLTDMSQPLGRWVGHASEVQESLDLLSGGGPADLRELTFAQAIEVASLQGVELTRERLAAAASSGEARETFLRWCREAGAEAAWVADPQLPIAPEEHVITAAEEGFLHDVQCRALGFLLIEAGAGRSRPGAQIDHAVALAYESRIGNRVERGQPLARLYLRKRDEGLAARFASCFRIAAQPTAAPPLVYGRVTAT